MSLDKPPPSRYRIEEKDGQLIVHDSLAGGQVTSAAPVAQPRSALDLASRAAPAAPSPAMPSPGRPTTADPGKAKRGGTVLAAGIVLTLFLIVTGLWPIAVLALIIPPIRKQLIGKVLPAVKRYVEEGQVG